MKFQKRRRTSENDGHHWAVGDVATEQPRGVLLGRIAIQRVFCPNNQHPHGPYSPILSSIDKFWNHKETVYMLM